MKHLALSGFDFLPIWKVRLTQRLPDLLSSSECFMCVWNSSPCYMPSFVEDAPGHLMMSDIQLMSSRSGRRQGPQMNLINGSKHPAVGKCKQRWYQVLLEHQKILHGGGTLWGGPWEVQRVTQVNRTGETMVPRPWGLAYRNASQEGMRQEATGLTYIQGHFSETPDPEASKQQNCSPRTCLVTTPCKNYLCSKTAKGWFATMVNSYAWFMTVSLF